MAKSLTSLSFAWTVHYHGDANPCCELTATAVFTDTTLPVNKDGTHNYTLSDSASYLSATGQAYVDKAWEANIVSELQTFAEKLFGMTQAQVQAKTTRTVSADYPAGS